jgi:hypothetical protein
MTISPNLSLRFSNEDKAALAEVAERLRMNKTQTVRVLVREMLVVLRKRESQNTVAEKRHAQGTQRVKAIN